MAKKSKKRSRNTTSVISNNNSSSANDSSSSSATSSSSLSSQPVISLQPQIRPNNQSSENDELSLTSIIDNNDNNEDDENRQNHPVQALSHNNKHDNEEEDEDDNKVDDGANLTTITTATTTTTATITPFTKPTETHSRYSSGEEVKENEEEDEEKDEANKVRDLSNRGSKPLENFKYLLDQFIYKNLLATALVKFLISNPELNLNVLAEVESPILQAFIVTLGIPTVSRLWDGLEALAYKNLKGNREAFKAYAKTIAKNGVSLAGGAIPVGLAVYLMWVFKRENLIKEFLENDSSQLYAPLVLGSVGQVSSAIFQEIIGKKYFPERPLSVIEAEKLQGFLSHARHLVFQFIDRLAKSYITLETLCLSGIHIPRFYFGAAATATLIGHDALTYLLQPKKLSSSQEILGFENELEEPDYEDIRVSKCKEGSWKVFQYVVMSTLSLLLTYAVVDNFEDANKTDSESRALWNFIETLITALSFSSIEALVETAPALCQAVQKCFGSQCCPTLFAPPRSKGFVYIEENADIEIDEVNVDYDNNRDETNLIK